MIRLTRRRSANHVPVAFRGAGQTRRAALLADIFYEAQQSGKAMDFPPAQWKPAKKQLIADTSGKCAYCEAPTEGVAHGDVEHFRPKSIYWWLAFCFDNYLYSCQICNQSYKSNHFPVGAPRLVAPAMPASKPEGADHAPLVASLVLDPLSLSDAALQGLWQQEDAQLPNPYLEDPEQFFSYELDPLNGEVWIRSAGGLRADTAVAAAETYLGLNREALRRDRFLELRPMLAFFEILELDNIPEAAIAIALDQIDQLREPRHPFAGMCRFFARQRGL